MEKQEDEERPTRRISLWRHGIGAVALIILGLIFVGFASGRIGNYEVISNSMAPTLQKGDRVLVDQDSDYEPKVGHVVVFSDPLGSDQLLTKRVAALEGETLRFDDGHFLVEDREWAPLGEPVRFYDGDFLLASETLGRREVFVLGDNVGHSEDSLIFGPIMESSIKGRLKFIYWPPGRVGWVR